MSDDKNLHETDTTPMNKVEQSAPDSAKTTTATAAQEQTATQVSDAEHDTRADDTVTTVLPGSSDIESSARSGRSGMTDAALRIWSLGPRRVWRMVRPSPSTGVIIVLLLVLFYFYPGAGLRPQYQHAPSTDPLGSIGQEINPSGSPTSSPTSGSSSSTSQSSSIDQPPTTVSSDSLEPRSSSPLSSMLREFDPTKQEQTAVPGQNDSPTTGQQQGFVPNQGATQQNQSGAGQNQGGIEQNQSGAQNNSMGGAAGTGQQSGATGNSYQFQGGQQQAAETTS